MMVRNDNFSSTSNTLALYCQWLESMVSAYEYIDFIIDDSFYITYYPMDNDTSDYTYNVYINNVCAELYHDVKVVAKHKHIDEFEVGYAILCHENSECNTVDIYDGNYNGGVIIDFSKIIMPIIEVE